MMNMQIKAIQFLTAVAIHDSRTHLRIESKYSAVGPDASRWKGWEATVKEDRLHLKQRKPNGDLARLISVPIDACILDVAPACEECNGFLTASEKTRAKKGYCPFNGEHPKVEVEVDDCCEAAANRREIEGIDHDPEPADEPDPEAIEAERKAMQGTGKANARVNAEVEKAKEENAARARANIAKAKEAEAKKGKGK